MSDHCKKEQVNNAGFSLIEVLVAMVILAIVSIPLLRAYVTAANTNGKAKITYRATNCAENLMENFKYQSVEDLLTLYQASGKNTVPTDPDANGVYTFTIRDENDLKEKLPENYSAVVTLDPTLYENANGLNTGDYANISVSDSAIFTMAQSFDTAAYKEFAARNEAAVLADSATFSEKKEAYFKDNISRSMTVSIVKSGEGTDSDGNTVDLIRVVLNITYEVNNYAGIFPKADRKYELPETELFNNLNSKTPLSGVFLFYNPFYEQVKNGQSDKITLENLSNIKTNFYVVALNSAPDTTTANQNYYSNNKKLQLTVIEEPETTGFPTDTKSYVTLRTNLNSGAPYSKTDTAGEGHMNCTLTYQNFSGTLKTASVTAAEKILQVGAVDGKSLDADDTQARIYKITTKVLNDKGESIVKLDGTKLE